MGSHQSLASITFSHRGSDTSSASSSSWLSPCLRPSLSSRCHLCSLCSQQGRGFHRGLASVSELLLLPPRHNTYLQECTGQREPTYQLNIHDIKLLFLRFAMEQSFSADTGGGGRESNIHLIPYIIHTVLYVLNTSVSRSRWAAPS